MVCGTSSRNSTRSDSRLRGRTKAPWQNKNWRRASVGSSGEKKIEAAAEIEFGMKSTADWCAPDKGRSHRWESLTARRENGNMRTRAGQ
jgi:hypothetical protein